MKLYHNDNLISLKTLPDNSIDAVITDPPYGLGKEPNIKKVLDAWLKHGYANIQGKGIMGHEWDAFVPQPLLWTEVYRVLKPGAYLMSFFGTRTYDLGSLAVRLAGFECKDMCAWIYGGGYPKSKGSLKPAQEPILIARKPLEKKLTLTQNIKKWGTGNLQTETSKIKNQNVERWPSNVLLDSYSASLLDQQSGVLKSGTLRPHYKVNPNTGWSGGSKVDRVKNSFFANSGGASRFYYVARASTKERNLYLESGQKNDHPTVKPLDLMKHLVKLCTPPGGTVLDPFMGSGTTGLAALGLGFNFIGMESDKNYFDLAQQRLNFLLHVTKNNVTL